VGTEFNLISCFCWKYFCICAFHTADCFVHEWP